MGFNSTIMILNDNLHRIKDDPDFGKKVYDAVCGFGHEDSTFDYQCKVLGVHHADNEMVFVVGGNTGQEVGYGAHWSERLDMRKEEDKVQLLKNMADRLGYSLRKKPSLVKKEKELAKDREEIAEAQFAFYDMYDNGVMPEESQVRTTGTWVEDGDRMLMNFWYTNPVVDEPAIKCTFIVAFEKGNTKIIETYINQ